MPLIEIYRVAVFFLFGGSTMCCSGNLEVLGMSVIIDIFHAVGNSIVLRRSSPCHSMPCQHARFVS